MPTAVKLSTLFIILLYFSTSLAMHLPNHPPPLPPPLRPHDTQPQRRNQEWTSSHSQSQKRYLSSNVRSYPVPVTERFQPLQGHLGRIIHVGQRRDRGDIQVQLMSAGEKVRGDSEIRARRNGGNEDDDDGDDDEEGDDGDGEDSGDEEWDDGKGGRYGSKNAKGEGSESSYSGERGGSRGDEGEGGKSGYDNQGGSDGYGGQGGSDGQSRKGMSGADSAQRGSASQRGQSRYNGDGDDGTEGHSSSEYGAGKGSSTSDKSKHSSDDGSDDENDDDDDDNASSSQSQSGSQRPWSSSSAQNNPSNDWANSTMASSYNTDTNAAARDCSALQSLYQAMIPAGSWTHTTGWDSADEGCCGWYGVTCGPDSRIVGLALSNNGLAGPLSSAIFSLDALVRLDISNNALTSLPDQFSSVPNLANLNAATNNLSTSIPSTLLASTSLITLNLADNSLSGDVAITSSSLVNLNLAHNHLTSISISGATSLSKLGLGWNEFSGNLPDLSLYTSLTTFDAGFNNIGTLFPLSALTNLTRLDVRSNALSGPYPSTFTPNQALTSLYLSSNAFSGPFPSETAPPMLSSCDIMPNTITPCPSSSDLTDPNSLASKCKLSCPKTAEGLTAGAAPVGGKKPAGIPVSPLPGEQAPVPAQSQPPTLGQTAGAERLQLPPPSSRFVPANQAARGMVDLTNHGQKSWSSSAATLTLVMTMLAILGL